jgi:hypothetical protein
VGVEKRLARRGRFGELLGGQFELRAGGHQAGAAGMLVGQPLHLVERRGDLVALDEPVELFEVADELGAAELDLLPGAARARSVGVDRHRRLRRCVPPPNCGATPEMYQSHAAGKAAARLARPRGGLHTRGTVSVGRRPARQGFWTVAVGRPSFHLADHPCSSRAS